MRERTLDDSAVEKLQSQKKHKTSELSVRRTLMLSQEEVEKTMTPKTALKSSNP